MKFPSATASIVPSSSEPGQIARAFISYSRSDQAFVDGLEEALVKQRIQVFRDRNDIEKGEAWWARIKQLIASADSVVFVLSPDSLTSRVVLDEVEFAASLNKRFLPVIAADIAGLKAPEALARLNYIYFVADARAGASGDFDEALQQLVRALITDIDWIREHTRMGEMALRWQAAQRASHWLLRGPALEAAERWLASAPQGATATTALQLAFVAESRRSGRNRLLAGVTAAIAVAVISTALAGVAWVQKRAAKTAQLESFVRQADLSASLAFRLYEQGDGLLGMKVALSGTPSEISEAAPLRPRLALALQRGGAMVQEEATLRHPNGQILEAVWSPDGRFVATATLTDGGRLWRTDTGELVQQLANAVQPSYSLLGTKQLVAFSQDGRHLFGVFDSRLKAWDVAQLAVALPDQATTALRLDAECGTTSNQLLRISKDGLHVAANCRHAVAVWNIARGTEIWKSSSAPAKDDHLLSEDLTDMLFVKDDAALLLVSSSKVALVEGLLESHPQLRALHELPSLKDAFHLSPVADSNQLMVAGARSVARVDLATERVVWNLTVKENTRWHWHHAAQADLLTLAINAQGNEWAYQVRNAKTGGVVHATKRLNLAGRNAAAGVSAIALSGDVRHLAVAMDEEAFVVRLESPDPATSDSDLQRSLSGDPVVHEERCETASHAAEAVLLFSPDNRRLLVLCKDAARVILLANTYVASLGASAGSFPRLKSSLSTREGIVHLVEVSRGVHLFEFNRSALSLGDEGATRSPPIMADIERWTVAPNGDAVFWVDGQGHAGSWMAGTESATTHVGSYSRPRALQFAADGRRMALLSARGELVVFERGKGEPTRRTQLSPAGRDIPEIRYAIDPGLRSVGFTSRNLRAAPSLSQFSVVLSAPESHAGVVLARCLIAPGRLPTLVHFSGTVERPQLHLVLNTRAMVSAPLEQVLTAASTSNVEPLTNAPSMQSQACPAALFDRFVAGEGWEVNSFVEPTVVLASEGTRLLYSDGETTPIELLDAGTGRHISDLVDGHVSGKPIAVSVDGRLVALTTQWANGVMVFDTASGTLLRKKLLDGRVIERPDALAFHGDGRHILVRMANGVVKVLALHLQAGEGLLEQSRAIGLQPLTELEKHEIYEFRKRFGRQAIAG